MCIQNLQPKGYISTRNIVNQIHIKIHEYSFLLSFQIEENIQPSNQEMQDRENVHSVDYKKLYLASKVFCFT